MALLIDPGIEGDCATYRCERDAGRVMAYPHYLDWPSYRTNMWLMYQNATIRAFFACSLPWYLCRAWRKSVDATFLMLYQFAHDCMHWSIRAMRRDHEGNIIGHTLRSRGDCGTAEPPVRRLNAPHGEAGAAARRCMGSSAMAVRMFHTRKGGMNHSAKKSLPSLA